LQANRPRVFEHQYTSWDRARLSVVVPIGVIVAVAIVCIVVAVLSSAQRADGLAKLHESQLLRRALNDRAEQVLRQVETVATSQAAIRNIRVQYDPKWVGSQIESRLHDYFDHDVIMVFDGQDNLITSYAGNGTDDPARAGAMTASTRSLVRYLHGRDDTPPNIIKIDHQPAARDSMPTRAATIGGYAGEPAIFAAVAVGPMPNIAPGLDNRAPVVMAVKLIDDSMLASIGSQLRLKNLRKLGNAEHASAADGDLKLTGSGGTTLARLVWTPKQPGAEIVNNVWPYIAVAMAGFALLAAFVLRYMRRTAVAIAAGETRLRHLAMHDPLCGLPNRIFFSERLEAVIDQVKNGSSTAAVFYIDLDHFKEVNDTLGHPVGDELIRNVTIRLSRALRGDDLVARLGGDEFAVISSTGPDQAKMLQIAQRIITTLCAPYSISKQTIVIGASIGIAIVDKNCGGAADVMRYADMALYRAKNEGRNRACVYDAVMDADLSKRKMLEIDLRRSIEANNLNLLYQPLVNASGEKTIGVEALCRWTHPTLGEISPAEFIPIAEHSGLIIELGEWVLRRACVDGLAWSGISVAVNVSALQFRRTDFVDMVERVLDETKFDPSRLELEVTESTLIGNVEIAEAAMRRLKALGVRLALDDFGTGYSSLMYLRRFPFDKLKIDRSFVIAIEKATEAAAIVHAIVSLGRGLGMKVTAEGVETADQQLFLRAAGVHSMQGYRFGRAVSTAEITARIASANAHRRSEPTALAG
jgi:diguanylate cyclase (GGDEF)-like protein